MTVIVVFILHFSDLALFLATLRGASPLWISLTVCCQAATYCCGAAVWQRVLARTQSSLPFSSLLRLSLIELFANQAIPTGGLSGSIMVMRGLTRRAVPSPTAVTALLVAVLSYFAAYFLVSLLAFVLLWYSGDLSTAWQSLLGAFVVVVMLLSGLVVVLSKWHARIIPAVVHRWKPLARLASTLDHARFDLFGDPRLVAETVILQILIFLLDAGTLWCACRAVGMPVDAAAAFVSFVLASLVATLSPIPLGLGTFEGTCTGLLHLTGGSLEASLAATLVLRGLTLWLPMLPGLWMIRGEVGGGKSGKHYQHA